MTRPEPSSFITSVRVEPSGGPHEYVSIWIRGQKVGTLCVGKGDGEPLTRLLRGEAAEDAAPVWAELDKVPATARRSWQPWAGVPCPPGLQPDERTTALARNFGLDRAALIEHVKRFIDYERTLGARREDWQLALRRWLYRQWRDQLLSAAAPRDVKLTAWMQGSLEAMQSVPEPEGGPDLYDPATRTVLAHPAQKLAVQAFAREQDHPTAEAEQGAPAPSREDANKAEVESRPLGVPSAAGAPSSLSPDPLSRARENAIEDSWREEAWREEETIG